VSRPFEISGILLIGAALFASPAWPDTASTAEALVEDYYSQFQKPGFLVDDLMPYYAGNVRFTDPTFEIVAQGKDEVRRLYADLGTSGTAYTDVQWDIRAVVSQDDFIVIRGKWAGYFHHCSFDIDFVTLWRMREGKIAEQHDFFAASTFDRQVGWDGTTATCQAGVD
jgi:ketosteroid isomerase-like protein